MPGTHPIVVSAGEVYRNPHYVPPEEFLELSELEREVKRLKASTAERRRSLEAFQASEAKLRKAQEELRALAAGLLAAQEEERSRLSRELHDDLNQRLALLALRVETLELECPPGLGPLREGLRGLQREVTALSDEIRRMAYQLHPSILKDLGLAAALKSLCEEYSRMSGLRVDYRQRNVPSAIPPGVALCLYRAAQEALRNVVRHSGAARAFVRLWGADSALSVSITDRGAGFDPEQTRQRRGLGLISMRERARQLSGTVSIRTGAGQGTRVQVRVPLPPRAN